MLGLGLGLGLGLTGATNRGGGPVAKTYADWVVEADRLAINGSLPWEVTAAIPPGSYTTTASVATGGALVGSSWNAIFRRSAPPGSSVERVIQHGLPDPTIVSEQRAGGFKIFFRVVSADGGEGYVALNRNGFLSSANTGNNLNGARCDLLIRWDAVLNKAFASNPSVGGAETEYTW